MPKGSSKKQREDTSQASRRILDTIIEKTQADAPADDAPPLEITPEMRAAAAAFGRIGGKIGGPARAARLDDEQKTAIARKAAEARWRRVPK
jgi:hypothetical protein